VRSETYDEFRTNLESSPHALPHNGIGADMATMSSPYDPVFFTHHTFVDKIYWQWQRAHPDVARTYSGNALRGQARETDRLAPYSTTPRDMYDIDALCYSYQDLTRPGAVAASTSRVQSFKANSTSVAGAGADEDEPKFDIKPLANTEPAAADDRSELTKLRVPEPVPEEWIEMNHLDRERTRTYETHCKTIYEEIEKIDGYISPCALYHREDLWTEIADEVKDFHIHIPKLGRIDIKVSQSSSKVVQKCKSWMEKYAKVLYKDPKENEAQLISLVGPSVATDPQSPANVMAAPPEATVEGASSGSARAIVVSVVLVVASLVVL